MANKPVLHRRDHEHGGADPVRIVWESTGEAGAGGGIQFEVDNVGGWLSIETTGTESGLSTGQGIRLIVDVGKLSLNSPTGDTEILTGRDVLISPDRDLIVTASRDTYVQADRDISLRAVGGNVIISGLPSSDPGVTGALWNDGGTVKVS